MFVNSSDATHRYAGTGVYDTIANGGLNLPTNYTQDTAYYMSHSAGQYATLDRFTFTQKIFGADVRFGTSAFNGKTYADFVAAITAVIAQNGGALTVQALKLALENPQTSAAQSLVDDFYMSTGDNIIFPKNPSDFEIGLSQHSELFDDLKDGSMTASDFADWTYVYGSSKFSISDTTLITLGVNGLQLLNTSVQPVNDDFDFMSTNDDAQVFNEAWEDEIAPNGGATFDITYTPSVMITPIYTGGDFALDKLQSDSHKDQLRFAIVDYWNDNVDFIWAKLLVEAPEFLKSLANVFVQDFLPTSTLSGAFLIAAKKAFNLLAWYDHNLATKIATGIIVEAELESDLGITLPLGDLMAEMWGQWWGSCFPAGTPITLADGTTKPIEDITPADTVLSHDANGNLVTGHVTRLLPSVTTEWLILSNGTTVTPGHRYLRPDGSFMEIADIIALDGRIVEADGNVITVTAERVVYSDATAHLYEQGEQVMYASAGSSALAPEIKTGWKTYNFTVAQHHTYIADGIRVHNDSILATLQEGDTLVALNDDLTDAAVLRDVGEMVNGVFVATPDGTADFVTLDGYRRNGEATKIALERVYAWNSSSTDLAQLIAVQMGTSYTDSSLASSNVFDPGLGSNWGDYSANGLAVDDIEEVFFDDILNSPASGTDRAVIDGLYSATFFADIDITSLVESGNVTASQELLDAIGAAAVTPADAVAMTAWVFGIEVGTPVYIAMLALLDDTFDDVVNTISGTSGDDDILGTEYADDINGGDGDDLIHGQGGDDTLNGGVGNDTLYGDAGADTVDGGAGDDVVRGGDGADLLFGRTGADTLAGNSGNDRLFGGGQNDLLFGGDGDDELNGGSNNDTLYGGADNDVLNGDDGNDIADGGDGDDVVYGGAGNDTLYGGAGDDIVDGGDGDDVVRGGDGADMLFGRAGADTLAGNYLDDRLFGGGQNDRLFGGGGDDELNGGSNDDILSGGYGSDSLTGDSGADTFLFETLPGTDTVQDFEDGTDVIQYQGGAFADLTIVAAGDDVDITGANGGHMILLNTDLALVTVDDFVF